MRKTLTFGHSEGSSFSPSDNVTFCDIGTSSGKNFLLRSLGVIFENLECRKNAALSDTLFFSHFDFQLTPTLSILRGCETSTASIKGVALVGRSFALALIGNQSLVVRSSIVSKVVADNEGFSGS